MLLIRFCENLTDICKWLELATSWYRREIGDNDKNFVYIHILCYIMYKKEYNVMFHNIGSMYLKG